MDLRNICYKQIHDNFYYGLFGDFQLVIDKNTEFFNADKLYSNNLKRYTIGDKTEKTIQFIHYLKNEKQYDKRTYEIKSNNELITGNYISKELLQSFIEWVYLPLISMRKELVYIITTTMLKFNNIYKIGYTKNVEYTLKLFNEYRHSSEPQFYSVALYKSYNAKNLETAIHKKLIKFRLEDGFFQCDIEHIKEQFKNENCEYIDDSKKNSNSYKDIVEKFKQIWL